jgi:uncharacterized membrane protein YfcA
MTWLAFALFPIALLSGATASVVGFGIGSLLTPLIASRVGTDIAVAAVMVPHAAATALRCWRLRRHIDRVVLMRFGLFSAAGSLAGALLYTRLSAPALTRVLGALLVLTAAAQLTGLSSRWHPRGLTVSALGVCSGLFGGLAGNQGGLRSAALSAFTLGPRAFVATATATGLIVDLARAPVYLWAAGPSLLTLTTPIAVATVGVLAGTIAGERVLLGLSPARFGRIVAGAVGVLGLWLLLGTP